MGAQWKQAGREANAQKKGQMVDKLVREIMVAAKLGGPDPDLNPRLAAAMEKARKASVYRDTIERAIKKGSGQTDEKVNFELVTYEGFAPHKVPVVVECLTDSRNRTAPEIRNIFKAGSLGQPGSVAFFFNHLGVVEATHTDANRDAGGGCDRSRSAGDRATGSGGDPGGPEGSAVPDRDQGPRPRFQSAEGGGVEHHLRRDSLSGQELPGTQRSRAERSHGFPQRARRPR